MKKYPVTIDNGAGELLTFIGPMVKDGVTYMMVENTVSPGVGPPMHIHHKQYEEITIIEGQMATQILGKEVKYYKAGDTICFEPGVAHRFWNAGDTMLKGAGKIWPIYNFEYFITEIFKSTKANGGSRPGLMDSAFLLLRYRSEFDMTIPPFAKKVLMPVIYFWGKLTGAYRKYADAPRSFSRHT